VEWVWNDAESTVEAYGKPFCIHSRNEAPFDPAGADHHALIHRMNAFIYESVSDSSLVPSSETTCFHRGMHSSSTLWNDSTLLHSNLFPHSVHRWIGTWNQNHSIRITGRTPLIDGESTHGMSFPPLEAESRRFDQLKEAIEPVGFSDCCGRPTGCRDRWFGGIGYMFRMTGVTQIAE